MATGTVADERTERKRELARRRDELAAAMAKYAAAEVAAASEDGSESHPAQVDRRVRRTAVSAARLGLEAAYRADASDLEIVGGCAFGPTATGSKPTPTPVPRPRSCARWPLR